MRNAITLTAHPPKSTSSAMRALPMESAHAAVASTCAQPTGFANGRRGDSTTSYGETDVPRKIGALRTVHNTVLSIPRVSLESWSR
jgi:hypothetical protein